MGTNLIPFLSHSLIDQKQQQLWAWGWNKYGQLCQGNTSSSYKEKEYSPVEVSLLVGELKELAVGGWHCIALMSKFCYYWIWNLTLYNFSYQSHFYGWLIVEQTEDGSLYSWGNNEYGQLGNGSTNKSGVPTLVSGIQGKISKVFASYGSSFAIVRSQEGLKDYIFHWLMIEYPF